MTVQAYCMKCKATREMSNPQAIYNKSGRPGTRGTCPVCGTAMFLMGRTEAHDGLPKPTVLEVEKRKGTKAKPKTKSKSKKTRATSKAAAARKRTGGKLVIVESPAKARSVGNFLGKGYTVKASKGHVRDLLVTQLSVDVGNNFEPKYRVPNDKRDIVKELKDAMDSADEIYLATDPDREGEAIAWHLDRKSVV